jgi:hypothetical protein
MGACSPPSATIRKKPEEGAHHEHLAVREVDELQDAVDHRVAEGHEGDHRALREPRDEGARDAVHRLSTLRRLRPGRPYFLPAAALDVGAALGAEVGATEALEVGATEALEVGAVEGAALGAALGAGPAASAPGPTTEW